MFWLTQVDNSATNENYDEAGYNKRFNYGREWNMSATKIVGYFRDVVTDPIRGVNSKEIPTKNSISEIFNGFQSFFVFIDFLFISVVDVFWELFAVFKQQLLSKIITENSKNNSKSLKMPKKSLNYFSHFYNGFFMLLKSPTF